MDGKTREDFEQGALIPDGSASNPWRICFAPVGKELQAQVAQLAQVGQLLQQARLGAGIITQQKQQISDLTAKAQELEAQLAAQPQPTPSPTHAPTPTPVPSTPTITGEEIAAAAGQAFTATFAAALQRTRAG